MISNFSFHLNNRWSLILFIVFNIPLVRAADTTVTYGSPMKIPLLISGNFGDIRANAFHFGIDFRTRPGAGFPVYAIADGFISRIKIEPGGYGRIVYIDHENGSTSTYAHLESLAKVLHDYVTNKQYETESFTQDLTFTPGQIRFKKGDIVGISGNAGLSSGPHLHFEIRDSKTQNPTNPFRTFWGMKDISSPKFKNLWIYDYVPYASNNPMSKKGYKVIGGRGTYHLEKDKPVELPSKAFIGVDLFDNITDSTRRLSFYQLKMFVDGELYYELTLDTLRFDQMNQVNTIIDFDYKKFGKGNIYTLVKWPNMDIKNVKKASNNGIIVPQKDKIYRIILEASDVTGNTSILKFDAVLNDKQEETKLPDSKNLLKWETGGTINLGELNVVVPEKALFSDAYIQMEDATFKGKLLTKPVLVGSDHIALKKPIRLSYDVSSFPEKLRNKLVIVSVSGLKNISSLGGTLDRNILEATSRWFGAFALQVDTTAPGIRFLNISQNKNMAKENAIRIKISDELSGIAEFKGFVDGKWVLFEYDLKRNLIEYKFDRQRMQINGKSHVLELSVTDKRGNTSKINVNFIK